MLIIKLYMSKKFNYDSNIALLLRIIKETIIPHIGGFSIAVVFMLLAAASTAYRAYLIKPAIDKVFLEKDTFALISIPLQVISIAFALSFTTYLEGYIMKKTTAKININYQRRLFRKLIYCNMDYFQNK